MLSNGLKAILSQFSWKKKGFKGGADSDSDNNDDDNDDDGIINDENEENDISDVDLACQASDETVLEEIAHEAGKVHKLSVAEDNLGHCALTKV
jgi:hypothetical protein